MAKKSLIIIIFLTFLVTTKSNAQNTFDEEDLEKPYFISLNIGSQMSGIKDEDFISSNYSPLYNVTSGKWFNHQFAIQVGYKGLFYYTIADDIKHYYNFLYADAVINFNSFVHPNRESKFWNILLHAGPGFYLPKTKYLSKYRCSK